MTHKKISVTVSKIIAVIYPIILVVIGFFIPMSVDTMIMSASYTATPELYVRIIALTDFCFYGSLAVALCADVLLYFLLRRVERGLVFTELSVTLLSGISYCLFAIGVLFAVSGIFFSVTFLLTFACVFLGLCLRVVKNVLDEGTEIKTENELTI